MTGNIGQKNSRRKIYVRSQDSPADTRLLEITHDLSERVKELNCLYGISRLFENVDVPVEYILQGVVGLIPPAWQYPEITCARIKLDHNDFHTGNFAETAWCQSQLIKVRNREFGTLQVCYLEEKPASDEGPFLKEERELLRVIAERLGNAIEHKMDRDNLKALYAREQELYKKLQMEMQSRADLTRKLIHELKTPLTSLVASSQMLYEETHDKRLERIARHVWDGANNLNNRIEELHDFTRGEMGKLKINPQKTDIKQLLQNIIEEAGAMSRKYNISIQLDIKGRLPVIYADPDRIRQILLNLINNACKYAREGKLIIIRASRVGKELQVEVKDFGPGIPLEKQSYLFESGYQTVDSENNTGGLGIGLALCKMLVELHNGKIWVESKPETGTSVFFTLPLLIS